MSTLQKRRKGVEQMQKYFRFKWTLTLAMASLMLTPGCGRSNLNQMAMPQQSWQTTAPNGQHGSGNAYSYASPLQVHTNQGTPQPVRGGKAVATPNGYVYEQDASTSNQSYNFYHSQNPCLYPKAGQAVQCSGSSSFYNGGQQTASPYNGQPTTAFPTPQLGTQMGMQTGVYNAGYPNQTAYAHNQPYGQMGTPVMGANLPAATSNPYGNTNPYANTGTQYTGLNAPPPLPQVQAPMTQPQQPAAPSGNDAQRAQSRIAPDGAESGGTSGGTQQKITF